MQYHLISPSSLAPTEEIDPVWVVELRKQILELGRWTVPIAIEKDALFVMDGHHRLSVALDLGLAVIPVVPLDYSTVTVECWRPEETITPSQIFAMAQSGRKFPCKTTRHVFERSLPSCAIPLANLRHPAQTTCTSTALRGARA